MLYKDINDLVIWTREVEQDNNEELMYMLKYFIEAFIKSIITFGLRHKVTIDSINLINEFRWIVKEEKHLHDYMLKEAKTIDREECIKLLNILDELNEKTIRYYHKAFNDILHACETNCVYRATHIKKDFKTLIETEEYRNTLAGLTLTLKDVKKFLNYEEEFWKYIDDKTTIVDSKTQLDQCGVTKEEDNIKIHVPLIINAETARMNKRIFIDAHEIIKQKKLTKQKNLK